MEDETKPNINSSGIKYHEILPLAIFISIRFPCGNPLKLQKYVENIGLEKLLIG